MVYTVIIVLYKVNLDGMLPLGLIKKDARHILNLGIRWRWVEVSRPGHFPQGRLLCCPLERRCGGPQTLCGRFEENSLLSGVEPPFICLPVCSRTTVPTCLPLRTLNFISKAGIIFVTKYRGKYRASDRGDSTALAKTGLVTGIYSDRATLGCSRSRAGESTFCDGMENVNTVQHFRGAAHFHCLENGKIYSGWGGGIAFLGYEAFQPTFSSNILRYH
jgi:hypothetical protein